MHKKFNIGIFDSGVGGLSLVNKIKQKLPKENIIYFADKANGFYGTKTEREIKELCKLYAEFLHENQCKIILIASSSAACAALPYLQEKFDFPVLGPIEENIKAALKETKNNHISILTSPFTAFKKVYEDEIKKYSLDIKYETITVSPLSNLVENGWNNFLDNEIILKKSLKNISLDSDTIILGSSYLSLIKDDIKKNLKNKNIIDPADQWIKDLYKTLYKMNLLNDQEKSGRLEFFVNKDLDKFKKVSENYLKNSIDVYQIF
ncbi:glutamate racemase [Cetobacterium ceti]|uniref:Glutamate racemase n=1 Tax=Cetobacterium ceti TaxID=180163 RepID=A0A1T4MXG9_9FUSO|nr:glutamate racemase [Cetobacterium ceti]SJZ71477.1 glutamate racemase [Cetobacterium ceti]